MEPEESTAEGVGQFTIMNILVIEFIWKEWGGQINITIITLLLINMKKNYAKKLPRTRTFASSTCY